MRELGQVLRTKRESLGLDLEEVQERTKIRKRYLIALETGDWSILPGYVYGRGFVRSYAEVLGMDGLELLNSYVDKEPLNDANPAVDFVQPAVSPNPPSMMQDGRMLGKGRIDTQRVQERLPESHETRVAKSSQYGRGRNRVPSKATRLLSGRKFNLISQVAVVVGSLGVIGGSLYFLNHGMGSTNQPPGNSVAQGIAQSNQANTTPNFGNGVGTANATYGQSTVGVGNSAQTQITGTVSIIPSAFQNNVQNYTVVTAQPLLITLSATLGNCWVQVSADNHIVDNSDMISQGNHISWPANHVLTIRLGNASAVQIQANGQPVQLPAVTNPIDVTFVRQ